jgi:hypothetical protein
LKSVLGKEVHDGVRYFTVRWKDSLLPEEQVLPTSPALVQAYLKRKEKKLSKKQFYKNGGILVENDHPLE